MNRIFKDRIDAGVKLAEQLKRELPAGCVNPIVFGIPKGGIAVGYPVAEALSCRLESITVRKLPTPGNEQFGFGAVTLDREIILNQETLDMGYVRKDEIPGIVNRVYKEVLRRDGEYRKGRPFPALERHCAIIVDDGLATGYTMLAAILLARKRNAHKVISAVPVAHYEAYNAVRSKVDKIICLQIEQPAAFAVAAYYESFPDMTDEQVITLLSTAREKKTPETV